MFSYIDRKSSSWSFAACLAYFFGGKADIQINHNTEIEALLLLYIALLGHSRNERKGALRYIKYLEMALSNKRRSQKHGGPNDLFSTAGKQGNLLPLYRNSAGSRIKINFF